MLEVAESWGSWSGDNLKGHSQLIFDVECNVSRLMIKCVHESQYYTPHAVIRVPAICRPQIRPQTTTHLKKI